MVSKESREVGLKIVKTGKGHQHREDSLDHMNGYDTTNKDRKKEQVQT